MHVQLSFLLTVMLVSVSVLVSGCATISNGGTQKVKIRSEPSGAKVDVRGKSQGETPVTVELERGSTHLVQIQHEGYERFSVTLEKEYMPAWFLEILFPPALAYDFYTGAVYKLSPSEVEANLEKE